MLSAKNYSDGMVRFPPNREKKAAVANGSLFLIFIIRG